jgi:NADH dehydrogenase
MKSLGDALHLRNHIIKNLEEADSECCADHRQSLLTIVVAGAGFAGVETVGGLNDFLHESLKFYPHLKEEMLRFVLVDAGPAVLPELSPKLGADAQKKLARRGIEIMLNTRVESASDQGVKLSNGSTIKTNTLIWTGGNAPHPLLTTLPCQKEHGRPLVNEFLEVPEWPGVWAVGDCAAIHDPERGNFTLQRPSTPCDRAKSWRETWKRRFVETPGSRSSIPCLGSWPRSASEPVLPISSA